MKRILIVDDVKGWLDYHEKMIHTIIPDCEIQTAISAKTGYDRIMENIKTPYDIVTSDLQMEEDFAPKYAGEWLIEQIKTFKNYYKTKIVIISASYNIELIAKSLGVDYIRKSTARNFPDVYQKLIG